MKFTKQRVKQIINEELEAILAEQDGEQVMAAIEDVPDAAEEISSDLKKEIEAILKDIPLDPAVMRTTVAALLTGDDPKVLAAIEAIPKAAQSIALKKIKDIEALAEPSGMDPEVLKTAVSALLSTK